MFSKAGRSMTAAMAMALCGSAMAQTTLSVGSPAPGLSVEKWLKGSEFTGFEKGQVYVVEFWATWCGPCVKNIPHLTELQAAYREKGVTIVGVASSERGDTPEAKLKTVSDFVGSRGNDIGYSIAFDGDRSMSADWMKPAGRNTIPTAFVVDKDGKISFIGNPSEGLDQAIIAAVNMKTPGVEQPDEAAASDKPFEVMVGDKPPELNIETWVKGEPVTGFEKGKVYVVEFWATWCGPCIAGMPHLTELQKEYKEKGVTFIGVNIWDDPKNVAPFMKERKDRAGNAAPSGDELMGYTVAIEKKYDAPDANVRNGLMAAEWMKAAGQNGIPCAFVVNQDGKIAYIGHPMRIDEPLKQVVEGKHDLAKAAKAYAGEMAAEAVVEKLFAAYQAGDWKGVISIYDEIEKMSPEAASNYSSMKFMVLLNQLNDPKAAYEFGRKLLVQMNDNAQGLNSLAWTIVDPEGNVKEKDLDLALKAATRADELTHGKDAAIIDTLARVYFVKGDVAKAIKLQTKAVENAQGDMKAQLEGVLEEYKKAQGPG